MRRLLLTFVVCLLGSVAFAQSRTLATADLNFFFSTSGSNSNPCTQALPCADPVHIYKTLQRSYDLAGYSAYAIGSGVYSGGVRWEFKGPLVGAVGVYGFTIKGVTPNDPNSLQIYSAGPVSGSNDKFAIKVADDAQIIVTNVSAAAYPGGDLFIAQDAVLIFDTGYLTTNNANTLFHGVGSRTTMGIGGGLSSVLLYSPNGYATGVGCVVTTENHAMAYLAGQWTLSNSPGWALGFVCTGASAGGIDLSGFSYSGAVSGTSPKCSVSNNGTVHTNGTGQSILPGNAACTQTEGGRVN